MKNIYLMLMGSLLVLAMTSCEDTIYVDIPEVSPKVVIEGQLISRSSDHQNFVRLTYSSKNSSIDNVERIHNAIVYIENDKGIKDTLKESWEYNGVYKDSLIKAELGNSYKLHVEIDGKIYESNMEQMAVQEPIDTAWAQNKETYPQKDFLPPLDSNFFIQVGYKKTSSKTNYSRWQLKRSSEFNNAFTNNFSIGNDELVAISTIEGRPLFLDSFDNGTIVRVERYSLNRDAYDFWLGLDTQLGNDGSPFDTPPAPLFTNLRNINDQQEQVLGYFTVSQLDEYLVEVK